MENLLVSHLISTNKRPTLPRYRCIWKGLSEFYTLFQLLIQSVLVDCFDINQWGTHTTTLQWNWKGISKTKMEQLYQISIKYAIHDRTYQQYTLIHDFGQSETHATTLQWNIRADLEYKSYLIINRHSSLLM